MFDALVFLRINFFIRKQRSMKTLRLVKLPAWLPPVHRSSFGSIEKCRYLHRRVLASEKPYEPVYKFCSPARSCTQANSTPSPHTAPVAARNAPVWARSHRIDTVCLSSQIPPQISRLWGFLTQERLFLRRLCPDGFHLYRKSLHK